MIRASRSRSCSLSSGLRGASSSASAASLAAVACLRMSWPAGCQLDHIATAIFGVGAAGDDALGLERVDYGDHRRAVNTEALCNLLLGGRLEAVDHQQHPELARVDAEGGQCLDMQLGHQPLRVLEQIAQPRARS